VTTPAVILVVEDERPVREFLAGALVLDGYRVVQAFHGEHALSLVMGERPDLVIADVMMPLMGGEELCRRLKADPATAAVPVILMSAARPPAARDAPADAFIAKPFDLDTMDALVHALLPAARRR
jgi:DNA-binding response OmpR family regulator